jgi:ATP/maltotriose-dependent transcriptional regulator MalT
MGPQTSEPSDWLVQTKLRPPLPRSDVIHRPRLLAALRDGLTSRQLTLLSAPAGYGKTTLLAGYWAEVQRCRGAEENRPSAPWLPCSPAPLLKWLG